MYIKFSIQMRFDETSREYGSPSVIDTSTQIIPGKTVLQFNIFFFSAFWRFKI